MVYKPLEAARRVTAEHDPGLQNRECSSEAGGVIGPCLLARKQEEADECAEPHGCRKTRADIPASRYVDGERLDGNGAFILIRLTARASGIAWGGDVGRGVRY